VLQTGIVNKTYEGTWKKRHRGTLRSKNFQGGGGETNGEGGGDGGEDEAGEIESELH